MGKPEFEARFGFLPIFDTKKQKRRSIAKHLAADQAYLDKHGFILIEAPMSVDFDNPESIKVVFGEPQPILVFGEEISTKGKTEKQIDKEIKNTIKVKRGRKPKKQDNGN